MECAGIAELMLGRLYALSNPLILDDRSSWYPAGTTGAVPVTSYLLREGERALLVDTGVTVHRDALIAQVAHVLPAATRLEILHTRIGEYDGTCNTTALLERFGVRAVYGAVPDCVTWTAFATGPAPAARPAAVESLSLRRHPTIELGAARPVTTTLAPLRLLPTFWVYDEAARALLTSDLFTHVVRPDASRGWVVIETDDDTTLADLRRHLLGTRYWWLDGADPAPIREALSTFFAGRAIDVLGPSYGCVLAGAGVVARHVGLLDAILADPAGIAA
jgi:hypothetical protein